VTHKDTLLTSECTTEGWASGEYPAVVIPVMTQHYPLLQRNLLYTAGGDPKSYRDSGQESKDGSQAYGF